MLIIKFQMSPTAVQPEIRGQGFLPPPAPPSSFLPPPAPQVSEEEDTKWFYLDPKVTVMSRILKFYVFSFLLLVLLFRVLIVSF